MPQFCLTSKAAVLWPLLLLIVFSGAAAGVASAESSTADAVAEFEKQIRPLLIEHCYACHSAQEGERQGGLVLDSKAGWSVGGDRGPAVVAGNAEDSLLIRAVRYTDPDLQMPPDYALPAEAVAALERWVQRGAADPRTEMTDADIRAINPADPVAGRQHWAFRPLQVTPLPQVRRTDWSSSPIDVWILHRLEAQGLQPAAAADRRTLARRLSFELTGLPPDPQQLTQFLNDQQPDAVARLVDQLLSSPQFGPRWGRHWLDLARYADSNGLDENFLFREAWRYRNWVIDAFNSDLPYDRFLLEQIAGDLLPFDSAQQRDRQRIAAGYLVIGPKVLLGNDPAERIMDVADEQLDTIGKGVLGQTLGCARCHDHKFDPIPTADYYALAGIMTSTQVMEQRYMLGQQRTMERLAGIGTDGQKQDDAYEQYWRERKTLQQRQQQAQAALAAIQSDNANAVDEIVASDPQAVASAAADSGGPRDVRLAAQQALVSELDKAVANPPQIPPRAMIPADSAQPADEHIRKAGQFDQPADKVSRGVLQVISDQGIQIPEGHSGRRELAEWLTDVEHGAGRLTARVLANRIWHHLLGQGIVRTVDNFGRTGEEPVHPELLDYLAAQLIESGWSVKSLIRQIVLTQTFAMSSRHDPDGEQIDPGNRLLWRANRQRLEPEALRDAMLMAADTLDLTPMESTVSYLGDQATAVGANTNRRRTDFPCRSVYLPVIRNDLPEIFQAFDFADPHLTTGARPQTLTANQSLFLLNDESVRQAALATATRVLTEIPQDDPDQQIDRLFQLLFTEGPDSVQREDFHRFLQAARQRCEAEARDQPELQAWTLACQALFASSRFQIVE